MATLIQAAGRLEAGQADRIFHGSLSLIMFSVSDQAKLAEILEDEKAETFLHGWTRKKPLIKGCGAYF